jgi:gliding motility-associated-like protein
MLLNPTYTYNQYGYYPVVLLANTKNGCRAAAEKTITIENVKVFAGNDTVVAINQPLYLNATGAQDYEWSPAEFLNNTNTANPVAMLTDPATYFLKGTTSEGCVGFDTLNIKVYKGPDAYVPNAFTPDHNGHNDIFRPVIPGVKELYYFTVFNRWGQRMFNTKEIGKGWDGTFNGIDQPIGAYVWMLRLVTYEGNIIEKNGTVLLIR